MKYRGEAGDRTTYEMRVAQIFLRETHKLSSQQHLTPPFASKMSELIHPPYFGYSWFPSKQSRKQYSQGTKTTQGWAKMSLRILRLFFIPFLSADFFLFLLFSSSYFSYSKETRINIHGYSKSPFSRSKWHRSVSIQYVFSSHSSTL